MDKIPCIKCTPELWEYITPYLDKWGYIKSTYYCGDRLEDNDILVINAVGSDEIHGIYVYNNYTDEVVRTKRELVTDVEEFLERAAKLKGFTYKGKDIMKINGVEIKPGMVIKTIDNNNKKDYYVVFPLLNGELGVISYNNVSWSDIEYFVKWYSSKIICIHDLTSKEIVSLIGGKVLWEKPKEVILTMDEIAKKFGYPVEQIKIKK